MFLAALVAGAMLVSRLQADENVAAVEKEVRAFLKEAEKGELADVLDLDAIARTIEKLAGRDVAPYAVVRAALEQKLARAEVLLVLKGLKTRRVEVMGTDDAIVIADVRVPFLDAWVRQRLAVHKTPRGWRIQDFGELALGLSLVEFMETALHAVARGENGVLATLAVIKELIHGFDQLDAEEASVRLKSVAHHALPRRLDAIRHGFTSLVQVGADELDDALASADRALALVPDLPIALQAKAMALVELGRAGEALPILARHRKTFGDSADARETEVSALIQLKRHAEAKTVCLAGLAEETRPWLVARYAKLLPTESKALILPYFDKLGPPGDALIECGEEFGELDEWQALELVCAHARKTIPDHPDVAYYDALAKWATGRATEAAKLVYPAIERAPADERDAFVELYLDVMHELEKGLSGYRRLADRDRGFGFACLARTLYDDDKYDDLKKLVNRRRGETKDLDLVLIWEAEILWRNDKNAELIPFLRRHAAAMARVEGEESWMPNDRLVRALIRLKKLDEAVREAKRIAAAGDEAYYLVMAYAASGRTAEAIHAFRRAVAAHQPDDLYTDEDMGPLLRKPAYKELHKKYPPPSIKDDEKK